MISANEAKKLTQKANADEFIKYAETEIKEAANNGRTYATIYWNIASVPQSVIEELKALGYKVRTGKEFHQHDGEIEFIELSWESE